MDILQGIHYFYTSNGQQVGPVEGNEMVRLAYQGKIQASDQVWTEGMPEWMPASSFPQLVTGIQAVAQAAVNQPADDGSVVVMQPGLARPGVIMVPREEEPPERYRKRTNFALWFWMLILALLAYGGGVAGLAALSSSGGGDDAPSIAMLGMKAIMPLAILFFVIHTILTWVYLYRAWSHIQELGIARTTPGKAVGFLFIPFFNWYWIFIAFYGWAEDFNRYIEEMGAGHIKPISSGFFLASCILSLLGLPLLFPFMMASLCRGTNDIADLPAPEDLGIDPTLIPGSSLAAEA